MVSYANIEDAKSAVISWNGSPHSVQHIGDLGNSVFSFKNQDDELQILRFTDPGFRSFDEVLAELTFVNHLHSKNAPVARAIPTAGGVLTFQSTCSSGTLICSSVAYAQGVEVQESSPYWSSNFFKEWGRNLALIHKASISFKPQSNEPKRWQWEKEILIANAQRLIPANDKKSFEEFQEVTDLCKSLPKDSDVFGLIHADHAPQNFRYDVDRNFITAFDFGNSCYHWFIADLAISLSTVRRKENREQIKDNILNGYTAVKSVSNNVDELIDLFIRLRVLYVYLSRLHFWSENRTPQQEKDLEIFKSRVHAKTGW